MKELDKKGTEAPWWFGTDGFDPDCQVVDKICSESSGKRVASWLPIDEKDGELICVTRNLLPALLLQVERMQEAIKKLWDVCDCELDFQILGKSDENFTEQYKEALRLAKSALIPEE